MTRFFIQLDCPLKKGNTIACVLVFLGFETEKHGKTLFFLFFMGEAGFFLGFQTSSIETGMAIELEAKVNEYLSLVLKLMFYSTACEPIVAQRFPMMYAHMKPPRSMQMIPMMYSSLR